LPTFFKNKKNVWKIKKRDQDKKTLKKRFLHLCQQQQLAVTRLQVTVDRIQLLAAGGGASASRGAFVLVSSAVDQDRAVDALSALEPGSAPGRDGHLLVAAGHSAVVSVITPITVADAMRTIAFK